MLIVSILAFFVVIFLLASITVTVAWMGFLKRTSETERRRPPRSGARRDDVREDVADEDPRIAPEESLLFRNERFSTVNFWDSLLARFDFIEILRLRIAQADMDWSVGRVTHSRCCCWPPWRWRFC